MRKKSLTDSALSLCYQNFGLSRFITQFITLTLWLP